MLFFHSRRAEQLQDAKVHLEEKFVEVSREYDEFRRDAQNHVQEWADLHNEHVRTRKRLRRELSEKDRVLHRVRQDNKRLRLACLNYEMMNEETEIH